MMVEKNTISGKIAKTVFLDMMENGKDAETIVKEKKLVQVQLKNPQIYLDVSIAYLKGQPLSPPAKAFVDTLVNLRAEEINPMGIGTIMAKILAQRRKASE